MQEPLRIVEVDRVDGDHVLVVFSDGTFSQYTAEELFSLGHQRQSERDISNGPNSRLV